MIARALLALDVIAVLLAVRVVRSRTLSLLLAFALVDELALMTLQGIVLGSAPRPFVGAARVAYHVETAFVLGWPAALAAAAWRVFEPPTPRGRSGRRIAVAWAGALAALVTAYPLPRGWTAPVLHAMEFGAVVVAAIPIARAWRSSSLSSRAGVAVGLLVAVELAVSLLGAWGHGAGVFTRWDELARLPYAIGWSVLVVLFLSWGRPWRS